MYKLIFLDTETTGTGVDDRLCQLAFKTKEETFSELFKPPIKIPPEASAVTHITNKMVADKDTFRESKDYSRIKKLLEEHDRVLVAHNALFDVGMLARESIVTSNFICTLRIARYLDKENKFTMYNLQYLRYALDLEVEAQAHDALGDVIVLEALFNRLFAAIKKEVGSDEQKAIEKIFPASRRFSRCLISENITDKKFPMSQKSMRDTWNGCFHKKCKMKRMKRIGFIR
jgi:exodeoxyribonuclease X